MIYCVTGVQQGRAAGAGFRRITYGCSQLLNASGFLSQVRWTFHFYSSIVWKCKCVIH